MLKHINDRDEFNAAIKEGVVLVDFFATWCGPCKMLSPVLEEVSNEVNATIIKVDVDEAGPLAAQYGIQAVPTLILFKVELPLVTKIAFSLSPILVYKIKKE